MVRIFLAIFLGMTITSFAQGDRWQQRVKYTMHIDMNVQTNRFTGSQKLEYTNNSPDTLHTVFYHLYFNAFQPNSMMDMRSRELGKFVLGRDRAGNEVRDWDDRVRDRISKLKPDEIGYQKIGSLKMNGVSQAYEVKETILQVKLSRPILPKARVVFDMTFEAQVPLQVRRSGRDNPATGVRYSMSQWYPKMATYDHMGWHPTPYVAREFYSEWGDFDVKITIDKNYVLGGTGYLQNASQIGHGYEKAGSKITSPSGNRLTWHFLAPNVHDFMWAADPDYKHIVRKTAGGTEIHVLYDANRERLQKVYDTMRPSVRALYSNSFENYHKNWDESWQRVADAAVTVFPFVEKRFGQYPYKQYSFIHGGDGGMEYPMSTLLSGPSIGTAFHELMHSWYQMVLGTNESLYAWMDEGFASFADTEVETFYKQATSQPVTQGPQGTGPRDETPVEPSAQNPHLSAYTNYFRLAESGVEEPMTTHADHFNTNYAYSLAAYSKGEVFLTQLGYIIGEETRNKVLLEYYRQWQFKHPEVSDFMRIAEKVSGMKLDWYREYWINTTKVIDYGIDSAWSQNNKTYVRLKRTGDIPMPVDLHLTLKNGKQAIHYIPMYLMFGEKPVEYVSVPRSVHEAWKWTHPEYVVEINTPLSEIASIEIDPTQRLADIKRSDNRLQVR